MIRKTDIHARMMEMISERISDLRADIDASKESRNTATKSSAGDKHETSRAMLQAELDNKEVQLSKAIKLKYALQQINPELQRDSIALGSLVDTSAGTFYISIGMGKITIDSENVFAISPASPIGIALLRSNQPEKIEVNNREITLKSVI